MISIEHGLKRESVIPLRTSLSLNIGSNISASTLSQKLVLRKYVATKDFIDFGKMNTVSVSTVA